MAGFETQSKVISLGEALVEELTKDHHSTTLSRWLAHYIAEQLETIKTAKGQERKLAQKRCFEAILQLWQHRSSLPNGLHPFGGFEPILRVLADINPEKPASFYAGARVDPKKSRDKRSADVEAMMQFVAGTDRAARVLIEAGLELAVGYAKTPRTKTYLANLHGKVKKEEVVSIARLMERLNRLEPVESAREAAERIKVWEKRIDSLDRFTAVAAKVREDLQARLKEAQAKPPKGR